MKKTQKLLIDTDIGDDVDDSLAIALAARSPEVTLAGITTVFRNVEKRAEIANGLLRALGVTGLPIVAGSAQPLADGRADVDETPCQWQAGDAKGYDRYPGDAADFIVESLAADPGLAVMAIGPFTNLALAAQKQPGIFENRDIYMMGGAFDSAFPEWNILCDPEAAQIVLQSGARLRAYGVELTSRCPMDEASLEKIKAVNTPVAKRLGQMIDAWRAHSGYGVYLHDCFPLCGLTHPQWFTYQPRRVEVELTGRLTRGSTVAWPDYYNNSTEIANVQVAGMENATKVLKMFMERVIETN